jgi:hypothetical protein
MLTVYLTVPLYSLPVHDNITPSDLTTYLANMSIVHLTFSLCTLPIHTNSTPYRFSIQRASTCQQDTLHLQYVPCQYMSTLHLTIFLCTLQICQQYTLRFHYVTFKYISTVHMFSLRNLPVRVNSTL